MRISQYEIKARAVKFAEEWKHEVSEAAEAKPFWEGFFHIFGRNRRRIATFEHPVQKQDGNQGFIDLLWKGKLLVEHKSRGKDLERAYQQAKDYIPGLKDTDLPRYILVTDFAQFRLYDLEKGDEHQFSLAQLPDRVHLFQFMLEFPKRDFKEQDPVNIQAAELMGRLHDMFKESGFTGHDLEVYLVRLLFCLFADDTTIFEEGAFQDYIEETTFEDGSNVGNQLAKLFDVLNTAPEARNKKTPAQLNAFPYVNGNLFVERIGFADFDAEMRKTLLDCCALDWGGISPAIFGSLFQAVMDEQARRNLGAHYTSEKNILKLIKPLFLDALYEEFEAARNNRNKLAQFHNKLGNLRFLDPACGCGNFLIIAYRELRMLELEVVKASWKDDMLAFKLEDHLKVNVDQFYGIEYDEFPAQVAQVAMWLMDHQMNMLASQQFGKYYLRLPLTKGAIIKHGNALRTDWQSLLPEGLVYDYIMGNPPFVGKHLQTASQKEEITTIFKNHRGCGNLDYVASWYALGCKYMAVNNYTRCAFVSTNSITQGEQVGVLWSYLYNRFRVKIFFAHQTFAWSNEAKGNAAVHCVIVGLSVVNGIVKRLFKYPTPKSDPETYLVRNINPYLIEGNDTYIVSRSEPICNVPAMVYGNKPVDGGFLFLTTPEKHELLAKEPGAGKFIKRAYGSQEYINNIERWCLWLVDITPAELQDLPIVRERVKNVRINRLQSKKLTTNQQASKPTLFAEIRQPDTDYIIIPRVSSENRSIIPIGLLPNNTIVNDSVSIIPSPGLFTLGILCSKQHMTWVSYVCGRLKSDYRYSASIVYNNFPWPENPTEKQKLAVEKAAQAVLDARAQFPESSLADLYDPITMPPALVKAHWALDKAVDLCYRPQPFPDDARRMEFLFELYEKYTAGLFVKEKKARKKK